MNQSMGTLRTMLAVDAVEDLVEAVAGDGEAVVALADDGARRVGRLAHELGDRLGELDGAARVVDLGGDGALDPRVHVEDRADVGMLAVDHPVLDRVDRHPPRLDARRARAAA